MIKLLVCGSRTFTNFTFLCSKLDEIVKELDLDDFELVTGGCPRGADSLAEQWAVFLEDQGHKKITIRRFIPDWQYYGRGAGSMANRAMAEYVGKDSICVAFRSVEGKSHGADGMIRLAKKIGMRVIVHKA